MHPGDMNTDQTAIGQLSPSASDATALLRRIERHVPLMTGRIVLALIRVSRVHVSRIHVVRASWIDPPAGIERDLRAGRADEGRPDGLRDLMREALEPLAATTPARRPDAHAIAMVRCRMGRAVWLPDDLAWHAALLGEAYDLRLAVAECFLVTEHGWRTHENPAAGMAPALAA